LLAHRTWSAARLKRVIARARRESLIEPVGAQCYRLTEQGVAEARRAARNHRLWELYLIRHADIAPSHVDRDADMIEHVLAPELVDELEALMAKASLAAVPPSPHEVVARTSSGYEVNT
jgi:manganese/zinc/iron transport system permease protein